MAHSLTEQLILATCQTAHWLTKIVGEDNSQCQQGALNPSHEACESEMDTFLTPKSLRQLAASLIYLHFTCNAWKTYVRNS
jgi:hypothetical protein